MIAPIMEAQRADRAQRLDRLDRVHDRVAARDRIANRPASDRVRERAVTDAIARDVADEPVREIQEETASEIRDGSDNTETAPIILDPFGDRVRRGEVLALNPSAEALAELSRRNLREVRQRPLSESAILYLFRSTGPANLTELLDVLQTIDPVGLYTPNHVFDPNGESETVTMGAENILPPPIKDACNVGLIDGPIHGLPETFRSAITRSQRFETGPAADSVHGTTVAFRLIHTAGQLGHADTISVCAADVFLSGSKEAITAEAVAAALNWQIGQGVDLVNASLAGPHNAIVAWSVDRFVSSGGTLVAAAGNGGPLSRNIFPAAYEGVVGVTAVDARGELYALASHGAHVDIAAHGVNVDASQIGIDASLSGTSFAAPVVTAWIAASGPNFDQAGHAIIDRGEIGRDDKFGLGELNLSFETVAYSAGQAQFPGR
ncbi:MAG: S8 family serine peptidase [Henriciella sp.]|nr:S8 family serine peptidase [Henriciella sp.]